jgi:glutaminyl-peptide cyclotransferase
MRTVTVLILIVFFTSCVLVNCAQSSKKTRKPVTSINIIRKNSNHTIGERITVNLKVKVKDGALRNTELLLDGKSLIVSDKTEFSFVIDTKNLTVGTHYLKTIALTSDGTSGENYLDFLLISDIVPLKYGFRVIKSYPHNIERFTEGLEIKNGYLYEGTGQEGSSAIYKTDVSNWKLCNQYKLNNEYFGEGITILNGKLYQLTYKTQIGFVRNLETFEVIKSWNFKNEQGWGLTNDGTDLIMSDGTDFICYLDPESLTEIKRIQVCNHKGVVQNLNELEYINGEIWANVWTTDNIVRINPETGKIVGEIDLTGLLSPHLINPKIPVDVLNGIAYDNDKQKIYVTGKLWPKIFEIEIIPKKR